MAGPPTSAALADELVEFRRRFETLVLATVGEDAMPHASHAPFVRDAKTGDLYVFVSALARHTAHLARGRAAVLLIEDQASGANPFARRRLTYQCDAERVEPGPEWERMLTEFSHRFGNIVTTLRQLPDFQLFRLRPREGIYVKGFGQAYRLSGPDMAQATPIGPQPGKDADPAF